MARRKFRQKSPTIRLGEVPTVEFQHQLGGTIEEVIDRDVHGHVLLVRHRLQVECILDAYLLRDLIEQEEHRAGMKYRLAWQRARDGLKVRDRFSSGKARLNYTDSMRVIEESERILKEADAVLSSSQKALILRVCCENERARGSYNLETLRIGLARMAENWKSRKGSEKAGNKKTSIPKS